MKTTVFIEALDLSEASIDASARTARVKLIQAGTSLNRRHYSEAVLKRAASLFEGVKSYSDHPTPEQVKSRVPRRVQDTTGWFTNVEYKEGALWAVRHFTRNQAGNDNWALAQDVIEGRAPASLFGLSINAAGKAAAGKLDDGAEGLIVESIDLVNSVDDVTTPAAGGGFERLVAGAGGDLTDDLLGLLTFEEWFAARPEFVERVKKEWQTVRQDEAIKAAKAEAERAQTALQEAQGQIETLTAARDAAVAGEAAARHELRVVETMATVNLPKSWRDDLRKKLVEAGDGAWPSIIEGEMKKAKAAGVDPRPNVTGSGQQVQNPTVIQESKTPGVQPLDMRVLDTPEKLAAALAQRQGK